jgi:hypothetical protein
MLLSFMSWFGNKMQQCLMRGSKMKVSDAGSSTSVLL